MVVKCRYYDRKERQEQPESIVPFPRCSQGLAKLYTSCTQGVPKVYPRCKLLHGYT